jgi:peptidoglycan/xylan/chitin deacetylase (PgdA/CDA1 family)
MGKFTVIYFRKYVASIVIAISVLCVGLVAVLGQTGVIETSNIVNGVYYSGNENSKNVSLMINVYWGDEYIGDMLDILKEKNVQVTFFLGGTWASDNENVILRMLEDGHELGNHGYSHKDCDKLSKEQISDEISKTHSIVKSYTGIDMSVFMPPSGAYDSEVVEVANSHSYKTIMWSKDTIDWRDQDKNLIISRATKNAKGGDLILMHPTLQTKNALGDIIDYYQNNGFSLVSVSKNINSL